ncbi:MAG: sigma-54 dependent transcriptional regulator [Treponemataceae bacterium]|nr:sigma-54 dependent transcriptional regulator [Treponemataceae bacterium]
MKLLILDDDKNFIRILGRELEHEGYEVQRASSGNQALEILENEDVDVLLLDLNIPGLHGLEVLKRIRLLDLSVEVIILTGHGTISSAVEAMKLGAYDFLTKPFEMDVLKAVIEKAYEKKVLRTENLLLRAQVRRHSGQPTLITQSPKMLEILEQIKRIALSDYPVLIEGESGVGKELIARAIHDASTYREGPFVAINCGAIPENMLESELFGHEKGAFTGAVSKKLGLLEIGENGSIFLDEIGELNLGLQGKLLRAIETGSFFRVGGVKEVKVQARFIAATNKDIKKEVEAGRFRKDLYYRINALNLVVPPLRERREDIPLLIQHFLLSYPAFRKKRFSPEAMDLLMKYPWPGNVRELQNVVHRAALLSKDEVIGPEGLPRDLPGEPSSPSQRIEDIEREHILKVLKEVGGHRGRAAALLGVDPKTLYRKLQSYGIRE